MDKNWIRLGRIAVTRQNSCVKRQWHKRVIISVMKKILKKIALK